MTNVNKTVAERLREAESFCEIHGMCRTLLYAINGEAECPPIASCVECKKVMLNTLADMIEDEQAELRAENERLCRDFYEPCARMGFTEHARGIETMCDTLSRVAQGHECRVDFAALDLLCDKLECGDASHRATAAQIRKAMNGVERSNDGVDVDALLELANKFDGYSTVPSYESFIFTPRDFNIWSKKIRDAVKDAKPQLPEGIEWPRDKNGDFIDLRVMYTHGYGALERVTFFSTPEGIKSFVMSHDGMYVECDKCEPCQPEVLDSDGVPIKVGDTVWYEGKGVCTVFCITRYDGEAFLDLSVNGAIWNVGGVKPSEVTHRKPDTRESVRAEIVEAVKADYAVNLMPLFDRYEAAVLRELGGEQS